MKVAIVVPTIRKESILGFLDAWANEFREHAVFVVEDNPEKTFDLSAPNTVHFSWSDIEKDLGRDSWLVPKKTDCIRSFGFYKAFESGADVILTLDDDCHPKSGNFLAQHLEHLSRPVRTNGWISTGHGIFTRGMPYENFEITSECVLNHGLWEGIPDFDAITQLATLRFGGDFEPKDQVIPRGVYFPMCGMNLAFKRKMVPAMYFLLMGSAWPFDRFGDIWCGLVVKKICDHLGFSIRSGGPKVIHRRASDVWTNLRKECPGYEVNEKLWQSLDSILLTKVTVADCYKEIADELPLAGDYWDRVRLAMKSWADLFASSKEDPVCPEQFEPRIPVGG